MKKRLDSNAQCFHYWAGKVQSEGELGNVSFRDGKFYSYRAAIAEHLPNGAVAITRRRWSPTTAKHQSLVRQASSHLKQIFVHDLGSPGYVLGKAAELAVQVLGASATRRQAARDSARAAALDIIENANLYAGAYGDSGRLDPEQLLAIDLEALKKSQQAELKRQHLERLERERVAKLSKAEKLAEWRTGGNVHTSQFSDLETALRLKDGKVQTTRGAEIPVEHAKQLWPIVQRVKRLGDDVDLTDSDRRLGVYKLDRITADGDITVGCHNIKYAELAAMAVQLGLS